jgi:hypothetical protein
MLLLVGRCAMSCETPSEASFDEACERIDFRIETNFFAAAVSDQYTTAAGGVHEKQFVWLLSFGTRKMGRRLRHSCQGFAAAQPRNLCSIIIARARP